ncbi:(2Fe-2S) ferredoxin domain-containing protein [Ilumatobacter nonamiensis]|uniref:(2Fe-2S) ferredoxin domain-containing protein n=1 Tax=Ilumatobacter nonamiensis TaxID=467093 RepID=UPI00034D530B|nr:(2Fe-2S) ferredoxin domain-containing protein [Ilumatobacter nonamiensis]
MGVLPPDVPPTVALCAGKDCRKRCEAAKIRDSLADGFRVVELKCVGICSGPVAIVDPGSDRPIVYSKLRSKRDRKLLVRAVAGEQGARQELATRSVTKKKARRTVSRRLERTSLTD